MKQRLFETEADMQAWLKERLTADNNFRNLLITPHLIEEEISESLIETKILDTYKHCLSSFSLVTIMFENTNISLKSGDILKPDFVLYGDENQSIIIVELKNLSTPSREAGTEISAYASEIKTHIPFISEGDIINVIISSEWNTLLKHYVFHEIFWLQRNIICLEPINTNVGVMLNILPIKSLVDHKLNLKLSDQHLGGYHICLYDDNLYNGRSNRGRLDAYIEQMKTAISAMSAKGNSHKNHGFAFLWKDNLEISLAPYFITLLNFAPFQSLERLFHDESFTPNNVTERFIEILVNYAPHGHSGSLDAIANAGIKFLEKICSPRREGFLTWDDLKEVMLKRGNLISFHSWGIFSELYSDEIFNMYNKGYANIKSDDPHIALELLDGLVDPDYGFIDLSYYDYDPSDEEE